MTTEFDLLSILAKNSMLCWKRPSKHSRSFHLGFHPKDVVNQRHNIDANAMNAMVPRVANDAVWQMVAGMQTTMGQHAVNEMERNKTEAERMKNETKRLEIDQKDAENMAIFAQMASRMQSNHIYNSRNGQRGTAGDKETLPANDGKSVSFGLCA
jgi:hypothetical protein